MEAAMNMGDIYAFGFNTADRLVGIIAMVLRKGDTIPNPGLLEAYLREASLALAWQSAIYPDGESARVPVNPQD